MFTSTDILERAIEIIKRGTPPYSWSDHGECCPWCAVAMAKSELDDEQGTGVPLKLAISQLFTDSFDEVNSDDQLVFARRALGQWNGIDLSSVTKEKAIEIISLAKKVAVIDLDVVNSLNANDENSVGE